MLQIELYVSDVSKAASVFTALGLTLNEEKPGWRKLAHRDQFEIMLFNPTEVEGGVSHWPLPVHAEGGQGIEIVIGTHDVRADHAAVTKLGYECAPIATTSWSTTEFIFKLDEGYLIRIKQ